MKSFSYETKASISFVLMRRMCLWWPIMERKEIIMWSVFIPIDKCTLIIKNGWMWSFSYETKALISFVSMKRMCLWCPIMKRKEIITWSMFIPVDKRTLIIKNGRIWGFSYETEASISFILMRRMCLWCPFMKRKGIIMWIHNYPNWQMSFNSKK